MGSGEWDGSICPPLIIWFLGWKGVYIQKQNVNVLVGGVQAQGRGTLKKDVAFILIARKLL